MKSLIDYCSEFFVDDLFVERKNPDQTDEEYEKYCKERKIDALCCKVALNRFLWKRYKTEIGAKSAGVLIDFL